MSQQVEKMLRERARRHRLAEPEVAELPPELDRAHYLDETVAAVASPNPRALSPGAVIQLQRMVGNRAAQRLLTHTLQRRVLVSTVNESAEPLIPQFVDRLNQINPGAITYDIPGPPDRRFTCEVLDESQLTEFDRSMIEFINNGRNIPFRFTNDDPTEFGDAYYTATVDIADLLAGTTESLQLNLLHILTERNANPNYETRRGNRVVEDQAHQAGLDREAEHLRQVLNDQTITYVRERTLNNGRITDFVFRSEQGYLVIHRFRTQGRGDNVRHSEVYLRQNSTLTPLSEFLANQEGQQQAQEVGNSGG